VLNTVETRCDLKSGRGGSAVDWDRDTRGQVLQ
jgi:hypothetical protein